MQTRAELGGNIGSSHHNNNHKVLSFNSASARTAVSSSGWAVSSMIGKQPFAIGRDRLAVHVERLSNAKPGVRASEVVNDDVVRFQRPLLLDRQWSVECRPGQNGPARCTYRSSATSAMNRS